MGLALRAVQVRLRFVVVLAVAFVVAGQWETVRNYGDKLARSVRGVRGHAQSVSPDTEYFCPMDPGVVSEWPGKCGVCNMALVRRKAGDAAPLPSGVVARMQFSPYRVQLAGIKTAPVTYEPLSIQITLVGSVSHGSVEAELSERERPLVAKGQAVDVTCMDAADRGVLAGKVSDLVAADTSRRSRVVVVVADPDGVLRTGMPVTVRLRRAIADLEPFRSLPSDPPPLRKGEAVAVYICPGHPDVVSERRGLCAVDGKDSLERHPLRDNQRVRWSCPTHPNVASEKAGPDCRECGKTLVPRVVTYRPTGEVLTVPESAVVDTGDRAVVYVERMPGMFDGVEVTLGPRCGDAYPVSKGLEPGQFVATAGAFLIDAETRLNPSLAAGYFGAGRREPETGLSAADQVIAEEQKVCPVTGKKLGSMGTPVRVEVAGKAVLICCEGCEDALKASPQKYLSRLRTGP